MCYTVQPYRLWKAEDSPMPKIASELCLCYATESWAFFTSQPLLSQYGDDWNDAPYESNAGEPYTGDWTIETVAWQGPFILPDFEHFNSPWSVQDINTGKVPWFRPVCGMDGPVIWAGTVLDEFCQIVREGGGHVYREIQ
jgi:hypothetical protein